jgi:hypothetical protein
VSEASITSSTTLGRTVYITWSICDTVNLQW